MNIGVKNMSSYICGFERCRPCMPGGGGGGTADA